MSVYTWFLSNSVSKADIDKSDDEIIASIDLNVINKRYTSEDEDNQTTIGKVQNDMKRIFLHSERGYRPWLFPGCVYLGLGNQFL